MYLGQSARRVFTSSEAGKQKRRERCGHSRQTQRTRTQVEKLEAWKGARKNLTGAKSGKMQNNYILGEETSNQRQMCQSARKQGTGAKRGEI